MPKPTAGMELPSPSETRESALVQVSEAMALLIRRAETSTKPAMTAVGPSCGMQNDDAMQVTRSKNMSSRCNGCLPEIANSRVSRGWEMITKMLNNAKTKAKTDLYAPFEMGIGRPTANERPFGPLVLKFKLNGFEMAARKPAFWQLDYCPGSLFRTYPALIRALSSRSVSEKLGLLSRPRQRQL